MAEKKLIENVVNRKYHNRESQMSSDLKNCVAVGGELGTSTTKFCTDNHFITFSSVIGDALTPKMEKSWRLMNRSSDRRWIRNLAIFDDKRNSWRYVGAMTRNSSRVNWCVTHGIIQNYDDSFLAIKAGLFCLNQEREESGKKPLEKISLGFGVTVRLGEDTAESFFNYLRGRLSKEGGKKYLVIKAKNVATNEIRELKINLVFIVIQYQAYGAYMVLLFKKFNMKVFNTYVIDIGHGTWIKLPIVENEADLNLSDSFPEGMYTITQNISTVIFESSKEKFKIPEQRIMEKLPLKDYKIEVPGIGIYNFEELLSQQTDMLSQKIIQQVRNDISALSRKGQFIDYFAIIGGGSHLLFKQLFPMIREYYGWTPKVASERIINPKNMGLDPRYMNCIGFMLVARDQIAIEMGEDVNTDFKIKDIVTDYMKTTKSSATKRKSTKK